MKKDESGLVMGKDSYYCLTEKKKKHTHISFSLISAGIQVLLGRPGCYVCMPNALYIRCLVHAHSESV